MRRTWAVAAALLLTSLVACGGGRADGASSTEPTDQRPTTSVAPVPTSASAPAAAGAVEVVASGRRPERPNGALGDIAPPVGAVVDDATVAWTPDSWGPTSGPSDPPTVPPAPPGSTYIVAWDQRPTTGWATEFTSARLVDGSLVISGVRTAPGAGCAVAQVVTSTSYLLSVAEPTVQPGTPVRFDLSETTKDCDG